MAANKLGYIVTTVTDKTIFIGGIMITDTRGIPLEFRYTEPVIPTKIQQLLYGKVLGKYIRKEVLATNLLGSIENKPDIMIVKDEELFDLKIILNKPIISIADARISPFEEVGTCQDVNDKEFLLQASAAGSPIRIKTDKIDAETRKKICDILADAGRSMDLVEPLNRVEGALEVICSDGLEK